jgi:hypothetical protein
MNKYLKFCATILLSILLQIDPNESSSPSRSPKCFIRNQFYSDEYLYTSKRIVSDNFAIQSTFLYKLHKTDELNKMVWTMLKVRNKNNTYYMKSTAYNQYLCAFNNMADVFKVGLASSFLCFCSTFFLNKVFY